MAKIYRAAVVGTGFIGPVHVEALRRAGIHVAGICGSSKEKSEQAAKSLAIDTAYESYEAVVTDKEIDSIHLATPNRFHFEQAATALKAGKHVLCEKPLSMNSEESAELVTIAEESGVVAGIAHNIRFYPLCQEAAFRVGNGDLGDILHVSGSYVQDWLLHRNDFNWRVSVEDGGALRAVADIGSHWLDLLQAIIGHRVRSVFADLQTVHATRERPVGGVETFAGKGTAPKQTETVPIQTEDAGNILLRFENNARGCLHVSQTTAGRKNCLRFEIAGSKQAMAWNSEEPNSLWIGHRDRANESLIRDPALMSDRGQACSSYPGGHNEGYPDSFKHLFRAFYGYIKAGDFEAPKPFPTFEDGHHGLKVCEAIANSHEHQTWVDVE